MKIHRARGTGKPMKADYNEAKCKKVLKLLELKTKGRIESASADPLRPSSNK